MTDLKDLMWKLLLLPEAARENKSRQAYWQSRVQAVHAKP